MSNRYETGTRDHVIHEAIRCAIQDRIALFDVHNLPNASEEDIATKEECMASVRDFVKLGRSLLGKSAFADNT